MPEFLMFLEVRTQPDGLVFFELRIRRNACNFSDEFFDVEFIEREELSELIQLVIAVAH